MIHISENNEIRKNPDFITYAPQFEGYKWYKPILVLVIAGILLSILSMAVVLIYSGGNASAIRAIGGGYNGLNTYTFKGLVALLGTGLMLPACLIAIKLVRERPVSSYFYSRDKWSWKLFIYPLIITLAVLIIPSIYLIYAHGLKFENHFTILTLILTLAITPLQTCGEELMFRGVLMQGLGSWFKKPILAIILQSLLFVTLHPYNFIGMVDIFVYGLFYGIVTWKTNGMEASMAMHAANNAFLFVLLGVGLYFFGKNTSMEIFLLNAIFTGIITIIVLALNKKYAWSED